METVLSKLTLQSKQTQRTGYFLFRRGISKQEVPTPSAAGSRGPGNGWRGNRDGVSNYRFSIEPLEIENIGEGSTRATVKVGADGKIYYYLLPGLRVWGLTLPEAKAAIERDITACPSFGGLGVGFTAELRMHRSRLLASIFWRFINPQMD